MSYEIMSEALNKSERERPKQDPECRREREKYRVTQGARDNRLNTMFRIAQLTNRRWFIARIYAGQC